jgi:nitroreductase
MSTPPSRESEELLAIIAARHCKRAFLPRPVPRQALEAALGVARNAPSTRNGQPWQVAVLTGNTRDELSSKLCAAFDSGTPARLDYLGRPPDLPPLAEARAAAAAAGVLARKGIARDDAAGRRAHQRDNLRFYGAPVELIFHLARNAAPGTFLEMGFYAQNVMLALLCQGLCSCPQASVAGYPDLIRDHLGLGPGRLVVCGMAVGYPDPAAPVNTYVPDRAALAEFTQWFGFAG